MASEESETSSNAESEQQAIPSQFLPAVLPFLAFAVLSVVIWGLPLIFVGRSGGPVAALVLVFSGLYFGFLRKSEAAEAAQKWRRGLGMGFMLAGFLLPMSGGPEVEFEWQPYDEALVAEAKRKGQPVMIDFSAAWCGPCKIMEREVFGRKKVAEAAGRFVSLKADMTDSSDPKVQALGEKYSIVAFPTVVFIGADGEERKQLRLIGVEWADAFAQRLAAVQ